MPGVVCDLKGGAPNTKRGRVSLLNQLILLIFSKIRGIPSLSATLK
jgi:hypothetical protein